MSSRVTEKEMQEYFGYITQGIKPEDKDRYELLRTRPVRLGDLEDLYRNMDIHRETIVSQISKEITIMEYLVEDKFSKEDITKAVNKYEENYKKVKDAMEAKQEEQDKGTGKEGDLKLL